MIDMTMEKGTDAFENHKQLYQLIPNVSDEVASVLARVETLINNSILWYHMEKQVELSKFKASIGYTHFFYNDYLVADKKISKTEPSTDEEEY